MKKTLLAAVVVGAALMTACGGPKEGPVMGSLSNPLDTLSYAMGINLGTGLSMQYKDLPVNYDEIERGLIEKALGQSSFVEDSLMPMMQGYFRVAGQRMQAIMKERMHQDSVRMAAGDSTKMEYGADSTLFDRASQRDSISYGLGYGIGMQMSRSMKQPFQMVWVKQGMQDAIAKDTTKMTAEAAGKWLQHYFTVTLPAANLKASNEWLEKISHKSGVQKTESGIYYKIDKLGDTTVMAKNDRDQVKVIYTGRTRKGDVFDSSIWANRPKQQQDMMRKYQPKNFDKDGNPLKTIDTVEFALNRVIVGWKEGMKLIGKGGKATLWIPADLAYGERGMGADIAPNEALEFEVELVDVVPYVAPKPVTPADSTATKPTKPTLTIKPAAQPAKK